MAHQPCGYLLAVMTERGSNDAFKTSTCRCDNSDESHIRNWFGVGSTKQQRHAA